MTWGCSERPNPKISLQRSLWKHQQQRNRSVVLQPHHGCVEITAGGRQCCRDDHQLWPKPPWTMYIYIQRCRRNCTASSGTNTLQPCSLFQWEWEAKEDIADRWESAPTMATFTTSFFTATVMLVTPRREKTPDTCQQHLKKPLRLWSIRNMTTVGSAHNIYAPSRDTPVHISLFDSDLGETYKNSHVPVAKRHFYLLTSIYTDGSPSFPDGLPQYTVEIFLQWKETRMQNSTSVHYHKGKQLLRHRFSINMLLSVNLVISNIKRIMVREPHGNKISLVCCLLCIIIWMWRK